MKTISKIVLVLIVIAVVVTSLAWYQTERGKVVALGQKPSPAFCWVSSALGYPGFNVQEQRQCEHILNPEPVISGS